MSAPVAVQLYTVRDALAEDFAGVVKRIAAIGYVGVEPAVDDLGATPEEAGRLFKDLGLAVPSAHTPLPLGERKNEVLDTMAALGCKCIVSGNGPDDQHDSGRRRFLFPFAGKGEDPGAVHAG